MDIKRTANDIMNSRCRTAPKEPSHEPRTITIALSCEGAGWLTKGRTLAPGLSGGATAICGASAALAIAAALPNHPQKKRAILFTVFGISALSSFAMIAYPMLAHAVGLDARQAGVFLGATIHDVGQVVGAGYSISPETGDVATFVKLLRVATLMPVIAITVMSYRHAGGEVGAKRPPPLPGFVAAFAGFALLHSLNIIPISVVALGSNVSQWCLVAAVAAHVQLH